MRLTISHNTLYSYSEPQRRISQHHRLYPTECSMQEIVSWEVSVENATFGSYFYDGAGDRLRTMSMAESSDAIEIQVNGELITTPDNGLMQCPRDVISPLVYLRDSPLTEADTALIDLARDTTAPMAGKTLDQAHALCHAVHAAIQYSSGSTDQNCTASQALAQGSGVCQDQTHCLLAMARSLGIPARYVVGYLYTDAAGQTHDASHAWAELFVQDLGWIGFDATNQCCPDERYIRLGSGLDARAAAPVRGIAHGSGGESLRTQVTIAGNQ